MQNTIEVKFNNHTFEVSYHLEGINMPATMIDPAEFRYAEVASVSIIKKSGTICFDKIETRLRAIFPKYANKLYEEFRTACEEFEHDNCCQL